MIALIGMSLGRDVKALRSLSWKIVIVALMTFTASFLAAAVIAQMPSISSPCCGREGTGPAGSVPSPPSFTARPKGMIMLITNVRPWGGDAVDLEVREGRIAAVHPAGTAVGVAAQAAGGAVDGRGRIALPAFTDVHVHLDSTRIGLPFREHTASPGVWNMMCNDRENWRDTPDPLQGCRGGDAGANDCAGHHAGPFLRPDRRRLQA